LRWCSVAGDGSGQREIELPRDAQKNPLLQHFLKLVTAGFERFGIGVDASESVDLAVERATV
jgi:hypothetical protein